MHGSAAPWPAAPHQAPGLAQCIVLAALLHILLVLIFGSAPGGSAQRGEGSWGRLNVTLVGARPDHGTVATVLADADTGPRGTARSERWGGRVRDVELPASEMRRPGAATLGERSLEVTEGPLGASATPPIGTGPPLSRTPRELPTPLPPAAPRAPIDAGAETKVERAAPAPAPIPAATPAPGTPVEPAPPPAVAAAAVPGRAGDRACARRAAHRAHLGLAANSAGAGAHASADRISSGRRTRCVSDSTGSRPVANGAAWVADIGATGRTQGARRCRRRAQVRANGPSAVTDACAAASPRRTCGAGARDCRGGAGRAADRAAPRARTRRAARSAHSGRAADYTGAGGVAIGTPHRGRRQQLGAGIGVTRRGTCRTDLAASRRTRRRSPARA